MNHLLFDVKIDEYSSTAKYMQLVEEIVSAVRQGRLASGAAIPSINVLSERLHLSRDTVEKAYRLLRKKKVLVSAIGRGYFVTGVCQENMHIALFLNKMSLHKKAFYEAFIAALNGEADIDLFIYDGDVFKLQHLLQKHVASYDYLAVFPYFNSNRELAPKVLSLIPTHKLLLLGARLEGLQGDYINIYEDHERDIYGALNELQLSLSKYHTLKLVYPDGSDYPRTLIKGFYSFCQDFGYAYSLVDAVEDEAIERGVCYINLQDEELIVLLEKVKLSGFGLGQDVGVIAYNETAWKRCLMNGITTISVDAAQMGKSAAAGILASSCERVCIPAVVRKRASC